MTALEKASKADAIKPDQPEVINFIGAIHAESGRYPEAIQFYEKSLSLNPKSFWAAFNVAEVDFIQQKYSEARTKFQNLMQAFPNHELLRFKIVLAYLLEKNDAAAKAELDKFPVLANTAAKEFSMAAWEFAHGNTAAGNEWIASGERIFGYSRTAFVYQSLEDLKWVPSPRPAPRRRQ